MTKLYLAQAIFGNQPQSTNTLNPQKVGGTSQSATSNLQQTPVTLNQLRANTPSSGIALQGITSESQVRQELDTTSVQSHGQLNVVLVLLLVIVVFVIAAVVRKFRRTAK